MKDTSKPILVILGFTTAFAVGQKLPPGGSPDLTDSVVQPTPAALPSLPAPPEPEGLPSPVVLPSLTPSPEGPPLIDLGASSEVPRAVFPEFAPVPEVPSAAEMHIEEKTEPVDRKWKVIPFAGFEVSWTDNLFISATKRRSDFFSMISPGLAAGWGDYGGEVRQLGNYERHFEPFDLDPDSLPKSFIFGKYNLNASFFAKNGDQNSIDHNALIAGRWEGGKLTIGGRFYFQTVSDRDIEVGNRVDRMVYGGEITSNYAYSGKTSFELNLYNRSFDYAKQLGWQEWMVEDWANYQVMAKTKVSLGTRIGLVNVESSPAQTFEQLVGRVAYVPSAKIGFTLDGGVEWRQFGSGGGNARFGIFSFSGTYVPLDGTNIAIKAYRRNSASVVLSGENITVTGLSALVRQRFLQRYFFAVEGGYEFSGYRSRSLVIGPVRDDETTYVRASVSFDVTKNLSAEAAYQYRQNISSQENLSFTENLFIVQFKLRL